MVLEKKEEVTALDMRLQALDKDLDWKKEVTAFLAIKVYTNTVEPVFDEPLYSVTSPLGYLYSRDTSICYGSIEETPLFRERCTFSEYRKHGLNLYSGDSSAPKKRLTQKIVTTSIS